MEDFSYKLRSRPIKLGIVASEFFEPSVGGMGGFGWAAHKVAKCFNADPDLDVEVVFLSRKQPKANHEPEVVVHGTRLIFRQKDRLDYCRRIWAEHFDVLLSIDYRPGYRRLFWLMPRTPIIVWVRDPKPPEEVAWIKTARVPGEEDVLPKGLNPIDCKSLAGVVKASKWLKRPVVFGTPALFLKDKVLGAYGLTPDKVTLLPNIIDTDPGKVIKSETPKVVFLARLDPYKRPWLFSELALHFPDVEFLFLGKAHFQGLGAWKADSLPSNVRLMGHVDREKKFHILSSAWVLVNTSISEGLAVSFQEALLCETPILSCVDPEGIVSRFGIFVGRWDGNGLEGMPKFIRGLNRLLKDQALRTHLGKEGRKWVEQTHNKTRFVEAFSSLCNDAGVK